jgi:glycogen debranching enzyme
MGPGREVVSVSQDRSPFAGTTPVASSAQVGGVVTLVEGQTFCLSGRTGDVSADLPQGLFVLDTRIISEWALKVNGHGLEPLSVDPTDPFAATFVGHAHPAAGRADADLVVFRQRSIGSGMRERISITNHGLDPAAVTLDLRCAADFADLFAVKESRVCTRGEHGWEPVPSGLRLTHRDGSTTNVVEISSSDDVEAVGAGWIRWSDTLAPGRTWELCLEVTVARNGHGIEPRFPCGTPDHHAVPAQRLASWRATLPEIDTDNADLADAVHRAGEDLGALRIFDPDHPETPILAAGAPWFMTVFGRDSLLTAWMTLLADPSLARGVLETLARFQGDDVDRETEEQPGKILHEMRFGGSGGLSLGGGAVYYGSIDATPLFVMLVGELRRWDPDRALLARLLPHVDRAMAWIEDFGDRDGDGYVEYLCSSEHGLANQGWKDSWDAIRHLDGELALDPIALCEVQGYVYAAHVARAEIARDLDDLVTAERCEARAEGLRRRFNEDFWVDEHGWYALGLDGDNRPITALASNMGQCLWTGIIDPDRASTVARRLVGDELFSGWGIRTLASSMPAYNPVSYHNGSVWPHDNALCAAGLARYGFLEEAHRVIGAQLEVAGAFGSRLPELFAGFDHRQLQRPATYPTSCSPQAWAAAAPLLWLRTLLRLEPRATEGVVALGPALPAWIDHLHVDGITVAGEHLTVEIADDDVQVSGAGSLQIIDPARQSSLPSRDRSSRRNR